MASTNQSPAYLKAQGKFFSANTDQERLEALDAMIKECPKHKSSENMLANLKTRKKKLQKQIIKTKKSGKSAKTGIKKEEMQVIIIGYTNSGKSSLLNILTNAQPKISEIKFATTFPIIGMMNYKTINMQIIENPSIESDYYDKGLTNTADTLLIIVNSLEEIKKIQTEITKADGEKIIIFNKTDLLSEQEKRKISATLQSQKYNFVLISTKTRQGINELKEKIFQTFNKIRIYTKEPNKKEKSPKPIIMKKNSTVCNVAEKILKGFSKKIKETRIWGPSSKFPGQKIGLKHQLKDLDVVEFKTR
ncbi:MAG: 50S ribosome-binding GTPase [Nanoarchaeota archaeon]|nr:50S ribosome-binding GTPase [Nanoarchaeota archaeon]MBU4116682.1 50S ribosome-binding GTPase [Nanoarchaeota archaeon]